MTGTQVAAEAVRMRPGLPVLFITGYADTDILKPWLAHGYDMLPKPFTGADLGRAIRRALARVE
jgi:FixJ family two-component response regulator